MDIEQGIVLSSCYILHPAISRKNCKKQTRRINCTTNEVAEAVEKEFSDTIQASDFPERRHLNRVKHSEIALAKTLIHQKRSPNNS